MKFYTGIDTIFLFNKIFKLIQPFLLDTVYLKGPKQAKPFSKVRHQQCYVILLTNRVGMMSFCSHWCVGLLNEGSVEKSGVSPTLFSYIFTTWVKL